MIEERGGILPGNRFSTVMIAGGKTQDGAVVVITDKVEQVDGAIALRARIGSFRRVFQVPRDRGIDRAKDALTRWFSHDPPAYFSSR